MSNSTVTMGSLFLMEIALEAPTSSIPLVVKDLSQTSSRPPRPDEGPEGPGRKLNPEHLTLNGTDTDKGKNVGTLLDQRRCANVRVDHSFFQEEGSHPPESARQ